MYNCQIMHVLRGTSRFGFRPIVLLQLKLGSVGGFFNAWKYNINHSCLNAIGLGKSSEDFICRLALHTLGEALK